MKTKIIYFLLLMSVIAMHSCSKSEPCNAKDIITYYNLTEEQKSKIPYKGSDTLMFLSDAGDTAILWGQGVNHYTEKISTRSLTGDCPDHEFDQIENIETNFIGNNPEFSYLNLRYKSFKHHPPYGGTEQIVLSVNVMQITYQGLLQVVNNINNYTDTVTYKGNQIYGISIGTIPDDKLNFIIYNYNFGVLKIGQKNGKIWVLI